MRQKFLIFAALLFLIVILIGLNAASYVQKDKTPDSEVAPNRSTFNTGATGTRAFYDLLSETGRRVSRWQEPPSALLGGGKNKPQTFIVIGRTRRKFDEREIEQLLEWVSAGGKLVVIDRQPPTELIKTTANWKISVETKPLPLFTDLDPSDANQMTEKIPAAKPTQPTVYTQQVNAVQPSLFASSIIFERFSGGVNSANKNRNTGQGSGDGTGENSPANSEDEDETDEKIITPALAAPFTHLANDDKNLLVDFPFGAGQIVFLSDPYIVSNGGINLVDNAQLAINIVASGEGVIAFDEYHQGFGAGKNQLFNYFAGTPLVAIFLQFAALIGFVFFTQSRRFARPLPEREPNRLSKLEYVSAMAELQQRTRAFDLAIENIYAEFRRRAARRVGADAFTTSLKNLAQLIAERAKLNPDELENLMFKCEEIIRGEPTNKREVLDLIKRLREVEEKLGLKRK
ncbi:MAG: DUF4350 domain-containing protein [Pyrinomonadaceae bacterium]